MGLGANLNHAPYTVVKYYKNKTLNLQKKNIKYIIRTKRVSFLLYALLFHALNSLFLHTFKESTVGKMGNVPEQQRSR